VSALSPYVLVECGGLCGAVLQSRKVEWAVPCIAGRPGVLGGQVSSAWESGSSEKESDDTWEWGGAGRGGKSLASFGAALQRGLY
jgi:hypothetical protein